MPKEKEENDFFESLTAHGMVDTSIPFVVSTTLKPVDELTGVGGFPAGHIIEVFGVESSGKSSLALLACGEYQRQHKKPPLYLDFEHAFNKYYSETYMRVDCGAGAEVDNSKIVVVSPFSMEDGFDVMAKYLEQDVGQLVIFDSLASAMPKSKLLARSKERGSEGSFNWGEGRIGEFSNTFTDCLQRMLPLIAAKQAVWVVINQLRDKIDTFSRGPVQKITPGGNALKFHAVMRLSLEIKQQITVDRGGVRKVIGNDVQFTMVKNKVGMPWNRTGLTYFFGKGFAAFMPDLQLAIKQKKVIKGATGYYNLSVLGIKENLLGIEAVNDYFFDHPEIADKLSELVKS